MNKLILFLSVLAMLFTSCQNKNTYIVEGSFADNTYNGRTAYVYHETEDSLGAVTRTILGSDVIKDNKFTIKGSCPDSLGMGIITVGEFRITEGYDDDIFNPVNFVLEPGTIKFSYSKSSITIGGTPTNDELNKMYEQINRILVVRNEIINSGKSGWEANVEYQQRTSSINADLQGTIYSFIKNNIANRAGEFYLKESLGMLSRDQINELYSLTGESFRSQPQLKMFVEELNWTTPDVGMQYANVILYDKDDKAVFLSDYVGKNKFMILNFWGSENPSFAELQSLKNIYNQFKGKGLDIIGVPLDNDKQEWLGSIKKYDVPWLQLADTTTIAIEKYGIETLPYNILIGEDGKIVSKGLVGKSLENKISEMLR